MKENGLFKGINRIVLALSLARCADALGNSMLFVLLPVYIASSAAENLPWSKTLLISIVLSVYGLVNTILQPLVGILTDRISRRKPLIIGGLLLMSLGTLSFLFSRRFTDLLLIRSLQGIGVALTVPASLTLISSSTARETRGRSMGFYSTLRLIGYASGPLLAGVLLLQFGFEISFLIGAGSILIAAILVLVMVREPFSARKINKASSGPLFDPAIWNRGIISLGIALFVMACAYSLLGTLENEFNTRLQQTVLGFGIASSALTISRMIVQTPLGYLSDKVGRKPLIILGLVLMAPVTLLMGWVTSTMQLTITRALQGFTSAAIASPALALAGDLSTEEGEGQQMSIATSGFFLGITIGPLIAGYFSQFAFALPFGLASVLLLIGAVTVHRFVPDQKQTAFTAKDVL